MFAVFSWTITSFLVASALPVRDDVTRLSDILKTSSHDFELNDDVRLIMQWLLQEKYANLLSDVFDGEAARRRGTDSLSEVKRDSKRLPQRLMDRVLALEEEDDDQAQAKPLRYG